MGIGDESNREQMLYDRLGPLTRQVVRDSPRILNLAAVLREFANKRDPIEIDGDFYPAPSIYQPAGDKELATYIEDIIRRTMGKPAWHFVMRPIAGRRCVR